MATLRQLKVFVVTAEHKKMSMAANQLFISQSSISQIISELEKEYDVMVVTQNVDNLHERAGSTHIIHLHGELTKVTSSRNPNSPRQIRELRPEEYEVKIGDKAEDGSQLRPYIVWFGEAVPNIEVAADYV